MMALMGVLSTLHSFVKFVDALLGKSESAEGVVADAAATLAELRHAFGVLKGSAAGHITSEQAMAELDRLTQAVADTRDARDAVLAQRYPKP